ncbi:MAG: hypothetical protein KDA05_03960 [Phycisphaerales bacterium]|nr:hypothetical protein [Phycisphaerales bacterium]
MAVVLIAAMGLTQPSGGASPPASPTAPSASPPVERRALPSLDELLGLEAPAGERPGEGDGGADGATILPDALDPEREALDRLLSREEMGQALDQAVRLMDDTAARLNDARDVGLVTQRLQEDILARLDAVITSAEQQQSSSSSSSSSSQQQQQQQQQQANQPGQQNQNDPSGASDPSSGENTTEARPPGSREGPLAPPVGPDGGVWGRLPPRVRDSLVQGSSDVFSSVYRRLTELYYQRLAEEGR